MKFWINTVANGHKGDIISLAVVGDDGNCFYEAVNCLTPRYFVLEKVLPVLGVVPIPMDILQSRLGKFLQPYTSVHLIAALPDDIMHFLSVICNGSLNSIKTPRLTMEIRQDISFDVNEFTFNALDYAKLLREKDINHQTTLLNKSLNTGKNEYRMVDFPSLGI